MEKEKLLTEVVKKFAKENKNRLAKEITNLSVYKSEDTPVSVFMAGSPGAGKTESSIRLIEELSKNDKSKILRIDADEYRKYFKEYQGYNSHLFHGAVSLIVEKVHDLALSNKQSFIFDGTLSNYKKAVDNIRRSLKKGRLVQIIYVYQEPFLAWDFTQRREKSEGRRILKEDFIAKFLDSRSTVNQLKETFKDKIILDLIIKDIDNSELKYEKNIKNVDDFIKNNYSLQELENQLE
jgi:predicted ABC-type ATPase